MNCAELNQDITDLRQSLILLKEHFDDIKETGRVSSVYNKEIKEINTNKESIFKKYYHVLLEKNPEAFTKAIKFELPIYDLLKAKTRIHLATPIPNENEIIFMCDDNLYSCHQDSNEWKTEQIDEFKKSRIESIINLPDDSGVLVGGSWGTLNIYEKQEKGWSKKEISNKLRNDVNIHGMIALPESNEVIIHCSEGTLYSCYKKDNIWELGSEIKWPGGTRIISVTPTPNGELIISGEEGKIYTCHKKNNEWVLGDRVEFDNDKDPITNVIPLPDGQNLLIDSFSRTSHCSKLRNYKRDNNKWIPEETLMGEWQKERIQNIAYLQKENRVMIQTDTPTSGLNKNYYLHDLYKTNEGWQISTVEIGKECSCITPNGNGDSLLIGIDESSKLYGGDIYQYRKKNGTWILENAKCDSTIFGDYHGLSGIRSINTPMDQYGFIMSNNVIFPYSYQAPTTDEAIQQIIEEHKS